MVSKQELSVWLASVLDECGYSEKRIQERIWMNDRASLADTISTQEIKGDKRIEEFLVGSLREGIAMWYDSDSDWLQVNKAVLCTDKLRNIKGDRYGRDIVRIDTKNAPSGYTYLKYNKGENSGHSVSRSVENTLVDTPNGRYLSNSKYINVNEDISYRRPGCIDRNMVYYDRKGPSIPMRVTGRFMEWAMTVRGIQLNGTMDFVRGFECHYPALTNKWVHRKRPHNWPSRELITELADLPIHVVPVGLSGSPDEDLQWRFSFTLAEIALVRSFNETQRKMLIILRQIAKYYLYHQIAPDNRDNSITSYIMKNLAFWVSEKSGSDKFNISQLLDRVMEAIDFLLVCVEKRVLHHYFIPERNLFHGKLPNKERKLLIEKLNHIKANGVRILSDVYQSGNIAIDFPNLEKTLNKVQVLNYVDKVQTLQACSQTPFQMAKLYTYIHCCKFWLLILAFTWLPLIRVFGTKWLSDPMGIDITRKVCEGDRQWFWCKFITRDKTKKIRLVKLEPCGWLISILFDVLKRREISRIYSYVLAILFLAAVFYY